jgi:hypothetical protein
MGLCISKPTVIFRTDEEGYLEKMTFPRPTQEQKQAARQQRRELIAQMGKRNYNNLNPQVESTVTTSSAVFAFA